MNRHTDLPTAADVCLARDELAETTGKAPAVVALAGRLGLASTTFRRHFPDIAADLKQQRAAAPGGPEAAVNRFEQLKTENDRLRRDNHDLRAHLDLAAANIQRLALENQQLRQHLESAAGVARLAPGPSPAAESAALTRYAESRHLSPVTDAGPLDRM